MSQHDSEPDEEEDPLDLFLGSSSTTSDTTPIVSTLNADKEPRPIDDPIECLLAQEEQPFHLIRSGVGEPGKSENSRSQGEAPWTESSRAESSNTSTRRHLPNWLRLSSLLRALKGTPAAPSKTAEDQPQEQQQLQKQQQQQQNNHEEDPEGLLCPICHEIFQDAIITSCGHSFCQQCIHLTLKRTRDCPICRKPLSKDGAFPVFLPNFQLKETTEWYKRTKRKNLPVKAKADHNMNVHDLASFFYTHFRKVPAGNLEQVLLTALDKMVNEEKSQALSKNLLYDAFLQKLKQNQLEKIKKLKQEVESIDAEITNTRTQRRNMCHDNEDTLSHTMRRSILGEDPTAAASTSTSVKRSLDGEYVNESKRRRILNRFEYLQDQYSKQIQRGIDPSFTDRFTSMLYQTTQFDTFRELDTIYYTDISEDMAIVSTMDFDRDGEYFALGGVTNVVKIYDYSLVGNPEGPANVVHCPVKRFQVGAKISCLNFNSYFKAQLITSDYHGDIKLWDVAAERPVRLYDEHRERAWTVDFSTVNPIRFASGGDDKMVRIWDANERYSTVNIPQDSSVCSVKFSPDSEFYVAVGGADHKVLCYDLRKASKPVVTFTQHRKSVSYVKWLNSDEIISASTDSTLKRWSIRDQTMKVTYKGHTNATHFVGLSVNQGGDWIAIGSEDNQVYSYHKESEIPVASYEFPNMRMTVSQDTSNDEESPQDRQRQIQMPQQQQQQQQQQQGASATRHIRNTDQFVCSTCWKKDTTTLLAANSRGMIKVLKMDV
ncbi:WD40-repeat-containing domain protein [Syncephalastrum racemosum]|uniref:WD40-repeat-containing domain protein n=1 Tax=Syncephalastrum racemosum TaxID=13706 RepID=A0A1X2H6Q3_SYNRA|nr:WD40-repeat-containing domain protein [Syncephalastrum racemosum]